MLSQRTIKYFVVPCLLLTVLVLIRVWTTTKDDNAIAAAIIIAVIIVLLAMKRRPMYVVEEDGIRIDGALNQKILFKDIIELRRIFNDELGMGQKWFGTRVPGVSMGWFQFSSLGKVFMMTNNDTKMVLIKTEKLQVIISPEDPDDFIRRLRPHD